MNAKTAPLQKRHLLDILPAMIDQRSVLDWYGRVVVPVFREKDGLWEHNGSALLVRLEGANGPAHWLVSAAHVLVQTDGVRVGIPVSRSHALFIQGPVFATSVTPKDALDDDVDAAVHELPSYSVDALLQSGASFLPIEHLDREPMLAGADCALVGFPDDSVTLQTGLLQKAETWEIHVAMLSNEQAALRRLDPTTSILAEYRDRDAAGNPVRLPSPFCMSGGTIWILRDDGPKVVGIMIALVGKGAARKRAIVGTRVGGIARAILERTSARQTPTRSGA